ncbi:MAG: esterase/lipase family protein [Acidimicrobiia bacterium]
MRPRLWWTALAAVLAVSPATANPAAQAQARPPGPPLREDPVALETALSCPDGLGHPEHSVVLLVHGTATTAAESWPAGFGEVLPAAGFDWCMVQLPGRALVDIQTSTEYVVAAVRSLHERTGRKVSLVGHSQGADQVRWAVRWWGDVRAAVDDLVTIAGANRPIPWTKAALCNPDCAPPFWQFSTGSAFLQVLNRDPVPEGPSYTTVRSLTDPLIQPAVPEDTAVATIDGATNVLVQDLCPGRAVDHVSAIFDAAVISLVLDAFEHPGPTEPARFDRAACTRPTPEEVDPAVAAVATATLYANAFAAIAAGPRTDAEPPLRDYAQAG